MSECVCMCVRDEGWGVSLVWGMEWRCKYVCVHASVMTVCVSLTSVPDRACMHSAQSKRRLHRKQHIA